MTIDRPAPGDVSGGVVRRNSPRGFDRANHNIDTFRREAAAMLAHVVRCPQLELAREQLLRYVTTSELFLSHDPAIAQSQRGVRMRDCARCWRGILSARSDQRSGFSVAQALFDLANGVDRPDLKAGFFAEMTHLVQGLEGRAPVHAPDLLTLDPDLSGRDAAVARSDQLDRIAAYVDRAMARYRDALGRAANARRRARTRRILDALGGTEDNWRDWRWHVRNIVKTPSMLRRTVDMSDAALDAVGRAVELGVPFGVTPFYLSLMDDSGFDDALRAQVFPSADYVRHLGVSREDRNTRCDFMMEHDTSPIDLVTRRYPSIVIFKPFNTCPQICVYCQRNWEIEDAMAPGALASAEKIDAAIAWISEHGAIREVLVTGGDPLALGDERLGSMLDAIAAIGTVERIRIGTRTPVTLPMRITPELAARLGALRRPGRREVAVVTHVEHPYEVNPLMVEAVERLRRQGIGVYNQMVFTFYNSRRFEAAALRRVLRRIGVDPYYVFNTKGKEETADFRIPIARLMQELKEEARLLPGLERTDEPVYNLPRLGKNYLRAVQHRDVLTVLPDGSRIYEFHPWEKNIVHRESHVQADMPILDYLERLRDRGENPAHYDSIWYYF